jgi:hypothetical protein
MLMLFTMLMAGTGSDAIAWLHGIDVQTALAHKFLIAASALVIGGVTIDRTFLLPAGILLGTEVVMVIWPEGAIGMGGAATVLSLVIAVGTAIREARAAKR